MHSKLSILSLNALNGLFTTRRVSEGPATKSLAYAAGYEKQSAFKLLFAMSFVALPYNENSIANE